MEIKGLRLGQESCADKRAILPLNAYALGTLTFSAEDSQPKAAETQPEVAKSDNSAGELPVALEANVIPDDCRPVWFYTEY